MICKSMSRTTGLTALLLVASSLGGLRAQQTSPFQMATEWKQPITQARALEIGVDSVKAKFGSKTADSGKPYAVSLLANGNWLVSSDTCNPTCGGNTEVTVDRYGKVVAVKRLYF